MTLGRLFLVFLRKNLLYLRFNWHALFVIFCGCFGILLLYLQSTYNEVTIKEQIYEGKDHFVLLDRFPGNEYDFIYYAPRSANVLMEPVRQELQIIPERYFGFENANEMRLTMEEQCRGTCFAVEFKSLPTASSGRNGSSSKLQYSISSNQMRLSPKKRFVNDDIVNGDKDEDEYLRTGFLSLQYIIDRQYISLQNSQESYSFELATMPSIEVKHKGSYRAVYFGTLFAILLSVLLLSTFLVPLIEEKQDGIKEFLILATPQSFLNGVNFFMIRLVLYSFFLVGVLLAARNYSALGAAPFVFMFTLYFLYLLSAISYAYLISVCFTSVFYAKVGGLLLLTLPYIFYYLRNTVSTIAFYIFSTKTFMEGLDTFQTFTNKHRVFGSSDLFVNVKDSSFEIGMVYVILVAQTIAYVLLYNYLTCVFPGPGGLKKPFWFFLDPAFYRKRQKNEYMTGAGGSDAIIIKDLVKKFKTSARETQISDNLNMKIKNKQITVLLGHNGAGKTTTLNMIMGLEPSDSGRIVVCSEKDVASYRHLIGFCPQHSVFMKYMTCKQHLVFFAQLRGLSYKEANLLASKLLDQLHLKHKSDEYGKNLSGGMKRRLSLGIALAGETKVVILDEPSSGLDIDSRRELWDILLNLRKTKAVLVTTHYMEEAEVLGDTICILANGCLQRTGSPLELKLKYGNGYRLKIFMEDNKFKEQETLRLIKQFIPKAVVLNLVKPTIYISLPYQYKGSFHSMLLDLERSKQVLGIKSISITDTSLEDVFLNCAAQLEPYDTPDCSHAEYSLVPYERFGGPPSCVQQFSAIAYKKMIFLCNEWRYSLLMLSLPILSIAAVIMIMHAASIVTNEKVLPLNLSQLPKGLIYLHSNDNDELKSIENSLIVEIENYGHRVKHLQSKNAESIVDELNALQNDNLADFLQTVIGVISISKDEQPLFTVYNSGNIYHSSVILTNLINTVMLKAVNSALSIDTTYVPIRRFVADVSPTRLEYFAVIVPIAMFFSMFFYVSLPFRENLSGFRDLQAVPRLVYWISMFLCDVSLHAFICVVIFLIQRAVMTVELYNNDEQLAIVESIFFYGCSYLPILYCFANSFKSISTISTYLLFMFIISAITPLITSNNVASMDSHDTAIFFLSFWPDFNLNHQLRVLNEIFMFSRRKVAHDLSLTRFFVQATFVCCAALAFLIYVLEDKYKVHAIKNFWRSNAAMRKLNSSVLDDDEELQCTAKAEETVTDILKSDLSADYPLLVSSLRKNYKRMCAVCGLNFAVEKGECFGLLGVNGAGKTTTFQMISDNATITDGTIKIDGYDIHSDEEEYRYRFGYCPQYDSLNKFMTAYQSLKFMAMLRGLDSSNANTEVNYWLEKLDLEKHKGVQIRHYSGGTKRKLLAAMAMIGSPSLVLLDEPTTGVDPVSRRFLWKCIKDFQKRDKTIVLTSHSMDECEELCNRLAIMANGKFKCLGGICALKLRYGSGFTIKIKLCNSNTAASDVETISSELRAHFPGAELREDHAGILTYFVGSNGHIQWSDVFKRIELFMQDNNDVVEDYSINESTLEDIFLKFERKCRQPSAAPAIEDV